MFNGLQLKSRYIAVDCVSNWVKFEFRSRACFSIKLEVIHLGL